MIVGCMMVADCWMNDKWCNVVGRMVWLFVGGMMMVVCY